MFKELKYTRYKRLKESMRIIIHKIKNISKEIEIIKKIPKNFGVKK